MRKPDLLSCAMMALVGTMWGLHAPAIKLAFAAGFTFPQLVLGEYLVGMSVFACVAWWQGGWVPASRRFWRFLLTAAVFGGGVPLFLFWSYALGPVPVGATLLFLYVPFTQLLNFVLTRRVPAVRELAAAVLVVTGAAVAAGFFGVVDAESLRGAPHAVAAAFCFAVFFVCTSRIGNEGTPVQRSLVCSAVACGLMLMISALSGWTLLPAGPESVTTALVWILMLGVFGQVIPVFLLVNYGPRTGSALGSILTSTELPVAVGVSALLLGDRIGVAQVVGVGLVLIGIALPHLRSGGVRAEDGM